MAVVHLHKASLDSRTRSISTNSKRYFLIRWLEKKWFAFLLVHCILCSWLNLENYLAVGKTRTANWLAICFQAQLRGRITMRWLRLSSQLTLRMIHSRSRISRAAVCTLWLLLKLCHQIFYLTDQNDNKNIINDIHFILYHFINYTIKN